MIYKCPAIESSEFLCDRKAEYLIEGTIWCAVHARRTIEEQGKLRTRGIRGIGSLTAKSQGESR
jgi:hypothetical protein